MSPLEYLYDRLNYERVSPAVQKGAFRLQRMRHLLGLMDNPQRMSKIVHVGGTKGKGSTCAMLSAMLCEVPGAIIGLYTSPHLQRLEERFRVNGVPCQPTELLELVEAVRGAADGVERMGEGPATFFELTTAMAFEHFRRRNCSVSVVEVGLGGRLDSTNVCDPVVSVLTSVGLDHQHILGDTVEKIAFEKAGIIKPGVPVISGFRDAGPVAVVRQAATDRAAPLWEIGRDFDFDDATGSTAGELNRIDFHALDPGLTQRNGWSIGLEGAHQQHNAAVALAAIDALRGAMVDVSLDDQRNGLAKVHCEGRVQRFPGRPETILDTSHNIDSIKALRAVLLNRPAKGKTVVVFGTSVDKDAEPMLATLCEVADALIMTRYWSNPRWYDPNTLAHMTQHPALSIQPHPDQAFAAARQIAGEDGRVVVCGSFFLAAEILPLLRRESVS